MDIMQRSEVGMITDGFRSICHRVNFDEGTIELFIDNFSRVYVPVNSLRVRVAAVSENPPDEGMGVKYMSVIFEDVLLNKESRVTEGRVTLYIPKNKLEVFMVSVYGDGLKFWETHE